MQKGMTFECDSAESMRSSFKISCGSFASMLQRLKDLTARVYGGWLPGPYAPVDFGDARRDAFCDDNGFILRRLATHYVQV